MTPSKFKQYSETWQLEPVFLLRDMPGAMHKMNLPPNTLLAVYPEGIAFDIKEHNIVDATDLLARAIVDDLDQETYEGDEEDGEEEA